VLCSIYTTDFSDELVFKYSLKTGRLSRKLVLGWKFAVTGFDLN